MSHSTTRMPSGYWAMALLLLIGSAAQATDFVRVPDAALRWAGGDPVDGPAFASADAPTWQMGEVGRKEAFRSDVVWVSVPVPKGDYRAPVLFLDGLSGIVELWTDGRRLYAPSWEAGVSSTEIVPIPVSALGERVELRIAGAVSRPMLSSVSLTEHELATREIVRRGFPSVMTAVLMLAVALAALLAWATTRDNRFPLFISIFSLASAAMSHGLGAAPAHFLPWLDWKLALQVGASAFPWAIIVLLRAGFPDSAPPWARWVERLTFGWMLTFFITFLFPALAALQLLAMVPFLAAIVTSIVIAAKAGLKGDIDGRRLVGAMLVLLSIISYDSLAQLGLRSPTGFHLHWGLISMTAAFVLIFTRRTAESAKALRDHTRRLAEREQESRALMTRLLTDAQELRAAVGDLRHSGDSQNEVIEKQAAALQETQVTAEEIRRTSTLAAEKAQALLEQANVVEQTQRAGEQAVEESMTGLSSIGDEVASMARSMNAVDALAQEISGILDVVRDLADQSNMLALNAAIEAVRSGEHGKGFAVVAREVRRLADQSLTATDRIRNALGRLDEGVKESSLAGARGERSIAQAIERLRGSGEQMRSMSEILRDTNASVRQISAAVTQQNAGISQIFTAVEHLSAQMQEAVQRVQDAQSATIVVENVAGRMAEQKQAA